MYFGKKQQSELAQLKAVERLRIKHLRDSLHVKNGAVFTQEQSEALCARLLFHLPSFSAVNSSINNEQKTIALYASMGSEVPTDALFERLIDAGWRVVFPKVQGKHEELAMHAIGGLAELKIGCFGVREPIISCHRRVDIEELDVIITPGLAFDFSGGRLGYGGGYYDRTLIKARRLNPNLLVLGLGYAFQVVNCVPVGERDQSLDGFILDTGAVIRHDET